MDAAIFHQKRGNVAKRPGDHSESSLILFHICLTSCSVLPSLDAMAFQEYRERSSAFKRRSFFFSSRVHGEVGLGERGGVFSMRRCRLAGALGVVFGLGRLAGVLSLLEKRHDQVVQLDQGRRHVYRAQEALSDTGRRACPCHLH